LTSTVLATIKLAPATAENQRMRPFLISALLVGSAAMASATQLLPRGSHDFQLSSSRAQVDSAITARGLEVISRGPTYIACSNPSPAVEFEQYDFAPTTMGDSRLWRVWIAFRVPYARQDFDSLKTQLEVDLGEPNETTEPLPSDPAGTYKLTWVDALTSVQLGARWPERPDPKADRMLVVWTDRKLEKLVEAQRKQKPKQK
jgi:hypothetical protein